MPNVSVFVSGSRMPSVEQRARFNAACTTLCTGILQAALEKVHIIFVPVEPGVGHDAYIEVKYREETFRPAAVMKEFLDELDRLSKETLGCTTRLRCFGYPAHLIHALN